MMATVTVMAEWYNHLPHTSLKEDRGTPAEAYLRKQAPKDTAKEMEEISMQR